MPQPRGVRNRNPGNLIKSQIRWAGQSASQPDPHFVVFDAPEWGIRALIRVLLTYTSKRKAADGSPIDTIAEIVARWAPPHENDTAAYTRFVSDYVGIASDKPINVRNPEIMRPLVEAIIRFENGQQPYNSEIDTAMELAGLLKLPPVPPPAPVPGPVKKKRGWSDRALALLTDWFKGDGG
jgi:hypothetical protein